MDVGGHRARTRTRAVSFVVFVPRRTFATAVRRSEPLRRTAARVAGWRVDEHRRLDPPEVADGVRADALANVAVLRKPAELETAEWLRERCRSGPFTTRGLAAELTARGIETDRRAVWVFVHAEGLSFKKNRVAGRTDAA